MKYYLIILGIIFSGCHEKSQMKVAPQHMSKYESCLLNGPKTVYNVKLYGAQKYIGVNNFRLTKNQIEIKNLLPSLAPQFQGLSIGADILTNGGQSTDLILDFESIYHDRFPIVLKDNEKLEITFYEQKKPDDLHIYCEFYWDGKE